MASTKRGDIAAALRARIREGVYPPATRIPAQRELLREFGASPVTVQRAIDRLAGQGFVIARGTAGTFVTEHPPDRYRCALVLPSIQPGQALNRFWSALRDAAASRAAPDGSRFDIVFSAGGDDDGHRRLREWAADGALAGILFATMPHQFLGSPLLAAALPRIAIGDPESRTDGERFAASFLHLRGEGLLDRLFAGFAAVGRRRVAVIAFQGIHLLGPSGPVAARRAGLETRACWWLGLPNVATAEPTARAVARLLCSGRAEDRPDCLVVADDNLVPAVTAGIVDAGRGPADLAVAAHANFPAPVPSAVPCRRYGYDAGTVLDLAWAEIVRLRDGGAHRTVEVPLVFDADQAGSSR